MRRIDFNIGFRTTDNAYVQIKYRFRNAMGESVKGCLQLDEQMPGTWGGFLTLECDIEEIKYGYEIARDGEVKRSEWGGMPHHIKFGACRSSWMVSDKWLDSPFCNYMQTGLFKNFYAKNKKYNAYAEVAPQSECTDALIVDIPMCGLSDDEILVLAGDADVTGCWAPERAVRMTCVGFNRWQCVIDASTLLGRILHYKFVAYNEKSGEARWEQGDNRVLYVAEEANPVVRRVSLEGLDFGAPCLRVAGTVIPLFSLRSENSWGVGDFGDLKLFAEWLAATGQHVLQLLPVNDTTICGGAGDSYPYNCVSVFALHPQYIDMSALPPLKDGRKRAGFLRRAKRLNDNPTFDYSEVNKLKEEYLRRLFDECGDDFLSGDGYKAFEREQQDWLKPYCAYRFLTAKLCPGPGNWAKYDSYDGTTVAALVAEYPDAAREMQYYGFVQYLLYTQLKEAHDYALSLGVALKGDIPIGVAPDGVDVWCYKELFNRRGSAGAPPDAFSADGQNWGFPTYNWEVMARDNYSWWRRRLKYMAHFFDAFRIDHILGFFRIWEIPSYVSSGLSGHFRASMPLSVQEIEEAGFPFNVSLHSCNASTDLPSDKPADLLFIPDENLPGYYHPRIMASETKCYRSLSERNRQAFDRIYEDFFYHRHTGFWFEEAMKKLAPLLSATSMTACGEDLGMIPECVPWAMRNLQVLSLEIQRMPKQYGVRFAPTYDYPYLSVATPSTHDMSTLREWWQENSDDTQCFYNDELGYDGKAPAEMSGEIARDIVEMHLQAPSMLTLIAWQDWMAMDEKLRRRNAHDERINIPSNRGHVWNYRMHMTIEELTKKRNFNKMLSTMIADSGRKLL